MCKTGIRVLGVLVILVGLPALPSHAADPPRINGGFWQPNAGMVEGFTDEALAQEVGHFRELGMDTIIFQYAGRWDHSQNTYVSYWPNSVFPLAEGFEERDPLGAVVKAAEEKGVKVVIGGLLMPRPRWEGWEDNAAAWTSREAMRFRREILERYAGNDTVVGWYTPNEYNPYRLREHGCDPNVAIEATRRVAGLVRQVDPALKLIHSVGLYLKPLGEGQYGTASIEDFDAFWLPWFEELNEVDVWMLIDGIGTRLSNLEHTSKAQRWMSRACERFGKTFWVDVENADMAETFKPFTMDRLETSLRVAAGHADRIVVFDYLHYMSRNSPKPEARKLHEEYRDYRSRSGARATDEPLLPPDWDPVRAGQEVMDRLIEVMPPPIKGAHDSEMVLVDNHAYIVASVNDKRPGHSWHWTFSYVAMSIVNLETLEVEEVLPIARSEQAFENETLPVGQCWVPRVLRKDDRTLRCYFTSQKRGVHGRIWYRDFDLITRTFENKIHRARLKTSLGTFDMRPEYFFADAVAHGFEAQPSPGHLWYERDLEPVGEVGGPRGWKVTAVTRVIDSPDEDYGTLAFYVRDGSRRWAVTLVGGEGTEETQGVYYDAGDPGRVRVADRDTTDAFHRYELVFDPAGNGGEGLATLYVNGESVAVLGPDDVRPDTSSPPQLRWGSANNALHMRARWNLAEFAVASESGEGFEPVVTHEGNTDPVDHGFTRVTNARVAAAGSTEGETGYWELVDPAPGEVGPPKDNLYVFDSFKVFDGITYAVVVNFAGRQVALTKLNDAMDTFEIVGHINEPGEMEHSEGSVNRLPDGTWLAILRSQAGDGNYVFSESQDGRIWSKSDYRSFVQGGAPSKPTFDRIGGIYYLGWQDAKVLNGGRRHVFNVDISRDGRVWERKYRFKTLDRFEYPNFKDHNGSIWLSVSGPRQSSIRFGRLEESNDGSNP